MHRLLPVLLLLCTPVLALDLTLAGKPAVTIVIPDGPLPVVTAAAEELQYHVLKASDATLPIVKEAAQPAAGPCVFLGPCKATAALNLPVADLKPNAFISHNAGDNLYLIGDDSAGEVFWIQHNNRTHVGTLFAVYSLLDGLGMRWLWPGPLGEVIPRQPTVRVNLRDGMVTPRFVHTRWRDGGSNAAGAHGWAVQENRSQYLNEQGKWLRRHRFAMGINMDMAHSFTDWWDRFGEAHPEYFNLLPDGTRRSDALYHGGHKTLISMCVGQPGVVKQKVEDWLARRSPAAPYLDASENDTCGKCICPLCLAMDEPDPSNPVPFDQRVQKAKELYEAGKPNWYEPLGQLSDRYARFFLALQKEAEKHDPQAVIMGYSYANYVKPPVRTKLNERIIIGIVPALMYPWTAEKRRDFIEQWNGWSAAGARLLLRPNYMLDGHNLPLNFSRALGEDFSFAIKHGLIGTDFDSLTGQWATQGPNLYMLARLHSAPDLTPAKVLDEYYGAFGKAGKPVRAYFDYWEKVANSVTDETYNKADLHWSRLYRDADVVFTPAVMAQGRKLLEQAKTAADKAAADPGAARVAFLEAGLRNAEMTLDTQRAFRAYREKGDIQTYLDALQKLDEFRAEHEDEFIANMAYLNWSEGMTWDRGLGKLMAQPGTRLPDPWKFMWEAEGALEGVKPWFAEDFDDSQWYDIQTINPWEQTDVGRKYKAEHKQDYDGFAWYRTTFAVPQPEKPAQVRLVFGAVDEACTVWLNGQKLLERPFPYQGNTDSWKESFEIDITAIVRHDRPNVLAVRVEDNSGAGGVYKPVWLVVADAPTTTNLLGDGGFEAETSPWRNQTQCGTLRYARDTVQKRSGGASARIECSELGPADVQAAMGTRVWGRSYQTGLNLDVAKTYSFRAWYRTTPDFAGTVKLWVTGTPVGTREVKGLNTQGIWRELRLDDLKLKEAAAVYLNLMDGCGKVWFDDVELVETGQ